MLAKAETRERRQRKLEHFFREAYALTFGLRPGERRRRSDASGDGEVVTVMRTSLSTGEFACALGMRADAVFVRKMFNIVDKDGDGRISFQEFLDTVVLFSRGKTEDKLRIIFDMCDNDRNGVIDKEELSEMLRSLVEIARTTSLSDDHVTELIEGMFQVFLFLRHVGKARRSRTTWMALRQRRPGMCFSCEAHVIAIKIKT